MPKKYIIPSMESQRMETNMYETLAYDGTYAFYGQIPKFRVSPYDPCRKAYDYYIPASLFNNISQYQLLISADSCNVYDPRNGELMVEFLEGVAEFTPPYTGTHTPWYHSTPVLQQGIRYLRFKHFVYHDM